MNNILFVPELLELILLRLDMKTLLVSAPRVCRHWAAIIADSPRIQQALFFEPVSSSRARRPQGFTLNPLLVEKFGRCFFDIDRKYTYLRRADSFFRLPWAPEGAINEQGEARSLSVLEKTERLENFTMSTSSWRRMLVSQPPPPTLGYLKSEGFNMWFHNVRTALIKPDSSQGLCMGQIYDMVHSTTCQPENYSTWYRVSWDDVRETHQTQLCREQCKLLFDKTNVAVEFYRMDGGDWDCGPWDISCVRETFRCGDGCGGQIEKEDEEAESEEFEALGLDVLTSIWWHNEEDRSAVDVDRKGYGYSQWPHRMAKTEEFEV
ncbi:f-box domain protein [Fusarium beomiforme]|uniref:F-box domain protein n=1 Tax=Fusarium beomiforme TaxID=44412 RepID=A0A9P5AK60_9HYPO|nr:f-box domain protein [Fusarium beomiforme]